MPHQQAEVPHGGPETLSDFLNHIPGMIYRCGLAAPWRPEYVSGGCEELTGYRSDEILAWGNGGLSHMIHPDDLAGVESEVAAAVAERRFFDLEYRLVRKDGRRVWVHERGRAVYGGNNLPLFLYGIYLDETRRREAEQRNQELAGRYQREASFRKALLEALPVAIFYKDAQGRYLGCNETFTRQTGVAAKDIIGRSVQEIWPSQLAATYHDRDQQVLADGGLQVYQGEIRDGEGRIRQVVFSKRTFADATGATAGLVGCFTDITDQLQREEDLRQAKAAAEEAGKARADFLASVSHEIRNPLNGVVGFTSLLLESQLDPDQRKFAECIRDSTNNLMAIINEILDYSKVSAGRLELETIPFSLAEIARAALEAVAPAATDKGIELLLTMDRDFPPQLHGDPLRLRQILTNLLGNAVKFTERGEVELTAEYLRPPDTAACVRIAIRDTGIGISPAEQRRIFRPFGQAGKDIARRFGGTGLGLAITKQIVDLMHGRIAVMSQPERGTTFTVELPLPETAQQQAAATETCQPGLPGDFSATHPLRILVAEDDVSNQRFAGAVLRKLGYEADFAANGAEVLEALQRNGYDLVLMDLAMPIMDGIEATRSILRDWPEDQRPAIIGVTAQAITGDLAGRLRAAGLEDPLVKPFLPAQLLERLKKIAPRKCGQR